LRRPRSVVRHAASKTVDLVHDWIWQRRGRAASCRLLLLKRLNLVVRADACPERRRREDCRRRGGARGQPGGCPRRHQLAWSWWAPVAYLWQDAAVVLVYAVLEVALRRTPRLAWATYTAFVAYVALGVPVIRVLSTPMTWTMWRAAGGALSDSVWMYVTPANVLWDCCWPGGALFRTWRPPSAGPPRRLAGRSGKPDATYW
jgi:hypothetical protein